MVRTGAGRPSGMTIVECRSAFRSTKPNSLPTRARPVWPSASGSRTTSVGLGGPGVDWAGRRAAHDAPSEPAITAVRAIRRATRIERAIKLRQPSALLFVDLDGQRRAADADD